MDKKSNHDRNRNRVTFPVDPFIVYSPPSGLQSEEVAEQKKKIYLEMINLANIFDTASKTLVEKSAFLAMQCHFNHFRGGEGHPHYSKHLLEVGECINDNFENFPTAFEPIRDQSGTFLDPKSIAISVGFLHDSIEDFFENFKSADKSIPATEAQGLVENHLRKEFEQTLGTMGADKIVSLIKALSIYNEYEFPTTEYLEQIKENLYTYMVKLADVSCNLDTFPNYSPVYPCLMIPAQFSDFAVGTNYEKSYTEKLLANVAVFDPDELVPWMPGSQTRTKDRVLMQVKLYEGEEGVRRINRYYLNLLVDIGSGTYDQYLDRVGLTTFHTIEQVKAILATFN